MMVRERHQQFQKTYGFASDTLRSIEYFDTEMLAELGRELGISWTVYRPWYGWQWAMRPWKARWRGKRPPSQFLDSGRQVPRMIILFHPRSTKPKNRRLPLSVLYLGAVLEGREEYEIVDGNADPDPWATIDALMRQHQVELFGVSVMPGPQLRQAVAVCRAFREKYPRVPIVWGGYFASLYTEASLNARYVDFVVKGQGEDTLLELIDALRGPRDFPRCSRHGVQGPVRAACAHRGAAAESAGRFSVAAVSSAGPGEVHRAHVSWARARRSTRRASAARSAAISAAWCRCTTARRWNRPARTASILGHLQTRYGVNAVQFYDNNFFLREEHARELADRIAPLNLRWWCEARVDIVLGYSDDTLRKLRAAGCVMIFFGVESGNDAALRNMKKQLTVGADAGTGAAHPRVRHRARVLHDLRQSGRTRSATWRPTSRSCGA